MGPDPKRPSGSHRSRPPSGVERPEPPTCARPRPFRSDHQVIDSSPCNSWCRWPMPTVARAKRGKRVAPTSRSTRNGGRHRSDRSRHGCRPDTPPVRARVWTLRMREGRSLRVLGPGDTLALLHPQSPRTRDCGHPVEPSPCRRASGRRPQHLLADCSRLFVPRATAGCHIRLRGLAHFGECRGRRLR